MNKVLSFHSENHFLLRLFQFAVKNVDIVITTLNQANILASILSFRSIKFSWWANIALYFTKNCYNSEENEKRQKA